MPNVEADAMIQEDAVLEDDYGYLRILSPGGLADGGAVGVLEFGHHEGDEPAYFWPIDAEGACNLIMELMNLLPRETVAALVSSDRKGMN